MIENFVPYEESLKLKELGFKDDCLGYYRNEDLPNPITIGKYTSIDDVEYEISGQDEYHNFKNIVCLAPLYQQAFKFFREKYNFFGYIDFHNANFWYFRIDHVSANDMIYHSVDDNLKFTIYEEAELECIRKLIKIANEHDRFNKI